MAPVHHISTLVSNHTSWADIIVLLASRFTPAFAAKKSLRKVPVFGVFCYAI